MSQQFIVIGGGTAGCVLARRLSEDPAKSVLLLEAGPDFITTEDLPADIRSGKLPPMSHDWGYTSSDDAERPVVLPRGKIIGGSSSTNYAFAMRARPSDHDEWASLGLEGWGFDDVLPLYREMENDQGGDSRWHGREGLFRLTRPDWDDVSPTALAFRDACKESGIPVVDDLNDPGEPGYGIVPRNVSPDGLRESLAVTYLNPVRDRPNLQVRGNVLVDRIIFDGTRAVGVALDGGEEIRADQVVLSAGAFNSPAILMRSGVGPREELETLGINVVHELPGVGRNLMEHPVFWNIYAAHPSEVEPDTIFQSCLSYRVAPVEPDYDLHLIPSSLLPAKDVPPQYVPPVEEHPTGFDFVIFVSNMRPKSRGRVRLASPSPSDAPVIELGLYSDPADAQVVAEGVRLARRLVQQPALKKYVVSERAPGPDVTDDELATAVQRSATHYNHPSGTCRMGLADDPEAVVDGNGRVIGLEGLAIVDASIIPVLPRVAINPTTVLIAEKLSRTF
jgi:choline dehydrogenase